MSWILVIENEEDIAELLRYILENENYMVKTAGSLAEARAHLKDGMPHAVIMDRGLPDGDGLELCRELKSAGKMPQVLVISALKSPAEVKEGLAAGADHYITKPFHFMDVISRLAPAL